MQATVGQVRQFVWHICKLANCAHVNLNYSLCCCCCCLCYLHTLCVCVCVCQMLMLPPASRQSQEAAGYLNHFCSSVHRVSGPEINRQHLIHTMYVCMYICLYNGVRRLAPCTVIRLTQFLRQPLESKSHKALPIGAWTCRRCLLCLVSDLRGLDFITWVQPWTWLHCCVSECF